MPPINSYATLPEFKNYQTDRGGNTPVVSAVDDVVIEQMLEQSSRFLDSACSRGFYPVVETRYFDMPRGRTLFLDTDLLAVISLTNGDGTAIASTEYLLESRNNPPYYALKLKELSSVTWQTDSDGNTERVIALTGFWGYHNRYLLHAWKAITTIAEDLDTSKTEWDVASITGLEAGQLMKIDNELATVSSTATGKVNVVARAGNGSTAASHTSGATVYVWQPMAEARSAVLELTNNSYHRRFGQSLRSEETITAAGIVLTPREIPHLVKEFIKKYQRYV